MKQVVILFFAVFFCFASPSRGDPGGDAVLRWAMLGETAGFGDLALDEIPYEDGIGAVERGISELLAKELPERIRERAGESEADFDEGEALKKSLEQAAMRFRHNGAFYSAALVFEALMELNPRLAGGAVPELCGESYPAAFYHCFYHDKKRNRLLFYVDFGWGALRQRTGLWEVDGASGRIRQVLELENAVNWVAPQPGEDSLTICTSWENTVAILDLATDSLSAHISVHKKPRIQRERPQVSRIVPPRQFTAMCEVGGWVWSSQRGYSGGRSFFRFKLDDPGRVEFLDVPTNRSFIYGLRETPDGKGFLLHESSNIRLFRVADE